MRRTAARLGLILAVAATATTVDGGPAPVPEMPYAGTRHAAARVEEARARVLARLPAAIERAEEQFGRELDRRRVTFRLQDIPVRRRARTTPFMRVRAGEPLQLVVYLEPVLRGSYRDSTDLQATLTHELIHVLARQMADPADYRRLPEWFQEGVAVHLAGQLRDKVLTLVAIRHDEPEAVLAACEGKPEQSPQIAGAFFCAAVEARAGRDQWRRFVYGALETGSVLHGLEAIDLMNAEMSVGEREAVWAELWAAAAQRARADLSAWSGGLVGRFADCMQRYESGGEDRGAAAIACFESLIADHGGTWAAEAATYWLARCHYRRGEAAAALAGLERFERAGRRYGLLDNARYYRIRLLQRIESVPELREACREYLELFPDGADIAKVREMFEPLPAAAGR